MYKFNLAALPKAEHIYTVERNTVWQIVDPYNILIVILSGCCRIETCGKTHVLKCGDIIFIPANQIYKRTPVDGGMCKMMYIHFTLSSPICELSSAECAAEISALHTEIEKSFLNAGKTNLFSEAQTNNVYLNTVNAVGGDALLPICEKLEKLISKFAPENSLLITLGICEILSLISRDALKNLKNKSADTDFVYMPSGLKKAVWFIRQNYFRKIGLDELCRYCNVSKSQLIRYFKTFLNKTPTQYIAEFKLNRAKEMFLNSRELSVKSVSASLGFDDQHYFSRLFTSRNGETPSQYKYRVTHYGNDKKAHDSKA